MAKFTSQPSLPPRKMNNKAKSKMGIYVINPVHIWYIHMNYKEKLDFSWASYPQNIQKYFIPMRVNFKMSIAFTIMNNRELLFLREIIREEMFPRCFLAKANDLHASTKRE